MPTADVECSDAVLEDGEGSDSVKSCIRVETSSVADGRSCESADQHLVCRGGQERVKESDRGGILSASIITMATRTGVEGG